MVRNPEQWAYWEIKYEDYKDDWNILKTQYLLWSWLIEQLWLTCTPHQAFITSKLECRETHDRLWVFLEAFFDCQLARRDSEELHGDWRNLATPWRIQRREGIENSGSEEPLQSILLACFRESWGNESGQQNLSQTYGSPCRGYWDLHSKWHDKSELSFLGDASGKIPRPYGISELDCELPSGSLSAESHARFAVYQGNRSSQIAGWPHHSEINNRQRFPWLWRIGYDDGGSIVKVLR